jgi:hypothetical protein
MQAEDRCEALNKELLQARAQLVDNEEEIKRLESESQQVLDITLMILKAFYDNFEFVEIHEYFTEVQCHY